ncbi:hypothetical protein VNI00_017225 [Paramarasmius palmivorus]|uniref:Uncharacterized protein n=1 Tax=Paramarasmius palmivorus TaxID=297713 RepID=A0AAW0B8J0_9AGAR
MVVALLVPEFMILWAMRQREKAKEIRERFKKYGWSMTHGFFVIMGGFSLYDGDKFCGYLWDRDRGWDEYRRPYDGQAERYLEEIRLHYENYQSFCLGQLKQKDQDNLSTRPQSNEHHVDPTKSTQEKKTLPGSPEASTLLEFLIAKGYINLNEDEIKDKSHADFIAKFIAVVQTAWFILQVIARAVEGFAITELEIITVAFAIINFGTYFLWWNKPLQVNYPVKVYWRHQEAKIGRTQEDVPLSGAVSAAAGDKDPYVVVSWMLRLIFLPVRILWRIFWLCYKILLDEDDSNRAISISSRFDKESPVYLYIVVYGIAAGFGAIHCIPWVFQFPTHTEQLLWRISAVAVAVAPIAGGVSHGYMAHTPNTFLDWKDLAMFAVIMILALAYAVFRLTLLVIAFTTLRTFLRAHIKQFNGLRSSRTLDDFSMLNPSFHSANGTAQLIRLAGSTSRGYFVIPTRLVVFNRAFSSMHPFAPRL